MDDLGYHALTCQTGGGLGVRHNALREAFIHFCKLAGITGVKREVRGLIPGTNERPADVLLPPASSCLAIPSFSSKPACLDFAVTHAQQPSVIQSASKVTAAAAERYENKVKYPRYGKSCADNNLVFVPMIVEAHGAWGPSSKKVFKFVTKAAAYSTRASSDRAASHLLQNLSVVLQRQNVLTILKHHPPPDLDSPIPEFSPSSVTFSSTSSPPSPTVSSSQSSVSTLSQNSCSSSSSNSCGSRNSTVVGG